MIRMIANYAFKANPPKSRTYGKTFAQAELMNEIEHQCLLEFFAEGDIVLTIWNVGIRPAKFSWSSRRMENKVRKNFQEKHLYYPIPTSELNNNTAMEQTSLWK